MIVERLHKGHHQATLSYGYSKGIQKVSRSVRAYFYLVLSSQIQARSSIVSNSSVVDARQVFKSTFYALIKEGYSINFDTNRQQSILEHALSKVNFSKGAGTYMLPSNLNLSIGTTAGYSITILINITDLKIGSNRNINKNNVYHHTS